MTYIEELKALLADAEIRLHGCESDTAYAAILRQVRGLRADINALEPDDSNSDIDAIVGGFDAVR